MAARFIYKEFEKVFVRKELPENIPEFVLGSKELKDGKIWIVELLLKAKLAATRNEARRLIVQGGVKLNDKSCTDPELNIELRDKTVIKAGKRRFARIKMGAKGG